MEHYAAIDVSLEWSSVCVVDAAGQIVREARVRSEREALGADRRTPFHHHRDGQPPLREGRAATRPDYMA